MTKICIGVVVSVLACAAQPARPLRGEIHTQGMEDLSWLAVRLDPPGAQNRGETAFVNFGGDFEFHNVPDGLYTLRVMDAEGNEILSQPVDVGQGHSPISIRLPQARAERPTGETTSVARLQHRLNRKVLEAVRKAQKFSESGNYLRSAEEWKKAVEADPEFSEAHGNLGAQYAKLHRAADAAEEFRRAIALDPYTAHHQTNLALVLAKLGQFEEAETWARHSVQLDGANPQGHYVLGCVLTSHLETVPEAIRQLQIAARQLPNAHATLAGIYRAQGKLALALAEMKQYQDMQSSADHNLGTYSPDAFSQAAAQGPAKGRDLSHAAIAPADAH